MASAVPVVASALCTPFMPVQGGTGNCGLSTGFVFFGNSSATSAFATSSAFFFTNSLNRLTFTHGSSTAQSISGNFWLTALGTPAGTLLAVDANGKVIATSTPSAGTGTVTNIATTFPIQGGPITTTGTLTFGGLGTTSPWTIGQLAMVSALNRVTSVATTTLSGSGVITVTAGASTIGSSPVTVACPTCGTGSGTVTSVGSGTGLTGGPITTTGTLALSSYLATSSAETSAQIPFWTSTAATPATLSGGSTGLTFNGTKLVFNYASSTLFSTFAGGLVIPNAASSTLSAAGQLAMNTTAASSSLNYYDGAKDVMLPDVTDVAFSYINFPTSGVSTSTFIIKGGPRARVFVNGSCASSGAGTSNAQLGSGSASTTMIVASVAGTNNTTFSSNNVFQAWQDVQIAVGTFSSTGTTTVSCSYGKRYLY